MNRRTALVCFLSSGLVAIALITLNRGFGARDLYALLFWTTLFSIVMGLVSNPLLKRCKRLSLPLRYSVAVVIGCSFGWLWTVLVASILGSWFQAFSFPVLACWLAGGASGMIAGLQRAEDGLRRNTKLELAVIAAICLGAVTVTEPLFVWLSGDHQLTLTAVKWKPGPQPLSVQDESKRELAERDLARLRSLSLTGNLAEGGSGTFGRGEPSRVLILMQNQLDKPVDLPQPNGVEIIYVQTESGWKMYPTDAPTLKRVIHLWPDETNPSGATRYWVELSDGARQGGTILTW